MFAGVALALSELPEELAQQHGLGRRIHGRGGEREVNEALGRFTLRSGATLPLKDVYRDEAQQYDICDVRGKICF